MKYVSLLGATGSIGLQTLDVIRNHPDEFTLVAFSSGTNLEATRKIVEEFKPKLVSVLNKEDRDKLKLDYPSTKWTFGLEGLIEVSTFSTTDVVVNAVMGSVGLTPTLEAIEQGKTIALANKETLVTAGHLVMKAAKDKGVSILPVDSEHSAIYQCLQGEREKNIDRLIITASGGSFRDRSRDSLHGVTAKEALNHPNWSMGAKITIDSATMMNKGLEVIEAHWLFGLPYEQIDVVLHRESIIHSMVEFHDSSVMAQLGTPDMRVPIQYALTYPDRLPLHNAKRLNLVEIGKLHFEKMDFERYYALQLAYESGKTGGTMPTVLNAANEMAVDAFLKGKIEFLHIDEMIEKALTRHEVIQQPSLSIIQQVDQDTRAFVQTLL